VTHVLVSGAVANKPRNGGNAWTRLNWALGLRKLGFDVHLVEQLYSAACVNHQGAPTPFEESSGLAYFREVTEQFGLARSSSLICPESEQTHGLGWAELLDLADSAELLINIGGHLTIEPLRQRVRRSVYLDDDPGYTQFWAAQGQIAGRLPGHSAYYTYGGNIGQADCEIPNVGIDWRPLRPPVVLELWPYRGGTFDRFTTVASWRGAYGPVEFAGTRYGLKAHEFRNFIDLPMRSAQRFEAALDIHQAETADLDLLNRNGWALVDPRAVAGAPCAYQEYIAGSGAEFSPAQGIYVRTRSGWFSDRTACYLASGKPALVQDTGFGAGLPTGDGLLPFQTLEQAVAGAAEIERAYPGHCHAARAIAEEYFDSDRVIGEVLEVMGVAP